MEACCSLRRVMYSQGLLRFKAITEQVSYVSVFVVGLAGMDVLFSKCPVGKAFIRVVWLCPRLQSTSQHMEKETIRQVFPCFTQEANGYGTMALVKRSPCFPELTCRSLATTGLIWSTQQGAGDLPHQPFQ